MQKEYERLMKKCINLARKSEGKTSPNPLVGAIIIDDEFNIISSGRHEYYGGNHAERNAILNAKTDLKGKTIIVNLEPCSHTGKTPPCADFIIEKGIKRVICGMQDPNEKVCGNGIKKLKAAGIEVITGILENECRELNKFFIKDHTKKLPYITIKTATTLDGKISTSKGSSKWITNEYSRKEVQKLRNKYDAILTSSETVIKDNPFLTCRLKNEKNPARIIIDSKLRTSETSNVYNNDGTKIYIITSKDRTEKEIQKYPSHVEIIKCATNNNLIDLKEAVKKIYEKGIKSIISECGSKLNRGLIEANLADELIQFIAPKILGDKEGIGFIEGFKREKISECNNLKVVTVKKIKDDVMFVLKFQE